MAFRAAGRGDARGGARGGGDDYLTPYRRAVERQGPAFESLLWRSREFQEARFAVIASLLGPGRRIGDAGCGRGDLGAYLARHGPAPAAYLGVDALEEMVGVCRRRAADEGWARPEHFITADFVADEGVLGGLVRGHGVDTLVLCGSLNTMPPGTAELVLSRAWSALATSATPGLLVFNFLSCVDGRPRTGAPNYRFEAPGLVAWALRRTPDVRFCQGYLGAQDATIAMRVVRDGDAGAGGAGRG